MKNAKRVKKLFAALLALCCIVSVIKPASAVTVQPKIDSSCTASATLKIALNSASCSVDARAKSLQHSITANMTLYCIDETPFKPLKTWSITGIYSISATETWYVSRGHDYQVIADITVKDSNSKLIESFTTTSAIIHY